jgi:hypothetical protein
MESWYAAPVSLPEPYDFLLVIATRSFRLSRTINGYYFQPSAAGRSVGRGVLAAADEVETFHRSFL